MYTYTEPLTTAKPTHKIMLFFSDSRSREVKNEIINIENFMAGVERKDPTFIGFNMNDGAITYTKKYLKETQVIETKPKAKSLF